MGIQERTDPLAILRAHTSIRYTRLDRLERFVKGTQYEGMPSWWADDVPLFKRGPCIVYPVVATAISSHVSMVLGKMPVITSAPDEDDEDDDFGLDEDDSKVVDRGVVKIAKQANLHTVFKQLLRTAMGQKSAVAVLGLANGKLTVTTPLAKWCKPTFADDDPRAVKSLEIRYPYLEDYEDPATRKKSKRCMLYRRTIDDQRDITYEPVEAPKDARVEPAWKAQSAKTIEHGFGFCPVIWYPFLKQETGVQDVDGQAIHDLLLDEISGLDFCLSQKHRAVLYNGDPVLIEIGVEKGYNPTETVDFPALMKPAEGYPTDPDQNKDWRVPNAGGRRMGRKRGPGTTWQYPANDGKTDVKYLALPPGAMEALEKHAADLELKIVEALHWMPIDPKQMASGATLSGRALEWLHKKQINFCDDVRPDFANNCALPVIEMLLRIVLRLSETPDQGLYLAGVDKVVAILKRFMRDQRTRDGQTRKVWVAPHLRVQWADYFTPSEADRKVVSDMARADLKDGVIKRATAVKTIAPFYGIENPAQYAEDMDKEDAEKAESLQASQAALAAAAQKPAQAAPPPPKQPSRPVRPVTQNGSRKPKLPAPPAKVMQ